MKKRFFMALFCAAMMLPAAAQWPVDDNNLWTVAPQTEDTLEHYYPLMIRKADGTTLVAYETLGLQTNPDTGQKGAKQTYYLYFQKLDKNGNTVWPAPGKLISHQHTLSASYGRLGMDTLSNGNVVLIRAEQRAGDTTIVGKTDQRIYVYCLDQEGNPVWSDATKMPVIPQQKNAFQLRMLQHRVTVSGDNIYATVMVDEGIYKQITPDSVAARYIIYFEAACLDFDGNVISQRIDSVSEFFNYDVAAAPNGDLYYVYSSHKKSYAAELLGPDCQYKWAQPTDVDNVNIVQESGMGRKISAAPRQMTVLEDGSLFLLYYGFPPRSSGSPLFYNRLNLDGSLFGHRTLATDSIGAYVSHACLFEGDTCTIFEGVSREISGHRDEYYIYFNRFLLSDGTKLLSSPTGFAQEMRVNARPMVYGLIKTGNEYHLLLNRNSHDTDNDYSTCETYGADGRILRSKPILGYKTDVYDESFIADGHYANMLITKDEFGEGGIWAANIDVTDDTNAPIVTNTLPGRFSVNANGKQVNFTRGAMEYNHSLDLFQTGSNQWETLNGKNKYISDTTFINWLNMFGWGTGDDLMKYDSLASYTTFTDWGLSDIRNTSCEPGTLRTLTADEWDYIINGRPNAADLRTIGGLIQLVKDEDTVFLDIIVLLPDTFEMPEGMHLDMHATSYRTNLYWPEEWELLEENGAVIIPLTGYRKGDKLYDIDTDGISLVAHIWTSTPDGDDNAKAVRIDKNDWSIESMPRCCGMYVRLVKDAESGQGIEDIVATKKDNSIRKVLINGVLYIIRDGKIFNATGVQVR